MQLSLFADLTDAKAPVPTQRAGPRTRPRQVRTADEGPDLFRGPVGATVHRPDETLLEDTPNETTSAVPFPPEAGAPVPKQETIDLCLDALAAIVEGAAKMQIVEPTSGSVAFHPRITARGLIGDTANAGSPCAMIAICTEWTPPNGAGPIIVLGCPANGRNGQTALAHLNHVAGFAAYVAFILADAFAKPSRMQRIDPRLHVIADISLPPDAFEPHAGQPELRARFMIFARRATPREGAAPIRDHPDFCFVRSAAEADFAIRRVGAHAGKVIGCAGATSTTRGLSPTSNYFICVTGDDTDCVRGVFERTYPAIKQETRGRCGSISKPELVRNYIEGSRET